MAKLSESETVFIVLVGSAGMLLLVGAIGFFIFFYLKRIFSARLEGAKRDREFAENMIKAQLESQEQERNRIGADLHDSLGSLLWAAKVNATFIQRKTDLKGEAKNSYDELTQILDQSIETMRRISWALTPEAFHHSGFAKSVETLCAQLNHEGLEVRFNERGRYTWNDDNGIQAFRIVQELISNAVKHSKASLLQVTVIWEQGRVLIDVLDNGCGFTLTQSRTGVGWWNIQQRVKRLNAEIAIGIPPIEGGTIITLIIPLTNEQQ